MGCQMDNRETNSDHDQAVASLGSSQTVVIQ